MSHDHLEFGAEAHVLGFHLPTSLALLRVVGVAPLMLVALPLQLFPPSRVVDLSTVWFACLAFSVLTWLLRSALERRFQPVRVRLTARQLAIDARRVPLHDVASVERLDGGLVFVLLDGERWALPRGYRLAPSDQEQLVAAVNQGLAGIAGAEQRPEARRALQKLREG